MSDLSPDKLFIGSIIHEAVVEVDEMGARAAAATVVGLEASSLPPPRSELVVNIDRPFFFFIRHLPTNSVWFSGKVLHPSATK